MASNDWRLVNYELKKMRSEVIVALRVLEGMFWRLCDGNEKRHDETEVPGSCSCNDFINSYLFSGKVWRRNGQEKWKGNVLTLESFFQKYNNFLNGIYFHGVLSFATMINVHGCCYSLLGIKVHPCTGTEALYRP